MIKQLKARTRPNAGSMYEIYYEGGGQLPGHLTGLYSSELEATRAINKHMSEKKVDATVKSNGGS